jgi:hypothetical protein
MKDNADWRFEEAHILRHDDDGMSGTQWALRKRESWNRTRPGEGEMGGGYFNGEMARNSSEDLQK